MKLLPRSFYERNTRIVAQELIGCILVFQDGKKLLSGKIVETEAYFGLSDPASHAYSGVTCRNQPMFGPAGFSYVYFTYGNHYCFNVVTERESVPGAVLIRALEPLSGINQMRKNRGVSDLLQLTSGPGKLTKAFGISAEHSNLDLTCPNFYLAEGGFEEFMKIKVSKRIGISRAKDALLRFCLSGNPHLSRN